jgi:hypothetical protein
MELNAVKRTEFMRLPHGNKFFNSWFETPCDLPRMTNVRTVGERFRPKKPAGKKRCCLRPDDFAGY